MPDWLRRLLADPQAGPGPAGTYHAYTTEFDEEIAGVELLAQAGRSRDGRALADLARAAYRAFAETLAVELSRLETATLLAAGRLGRSDPPGLAATLLVDHSGSMRGANIQLAAMIAQCFMQLATETGTTFEVLGFTTAGWQGGRSRRAWLADGAPPSPGRLCDLRHIVHATSGPRRPPAPVAMFLPGLLKENVDGEAVQWAVGRLARSAAPRRLLVVVSDGAPVDDSTLAANPADFLWQHLRLVTRTIAASGEVRLAGIGIGHDVRPAYPTTCHVRLFGEVETTVLPFLETLFATDLPGPGPAGPPQAPQLQKPR